MARIKRQAKGPDQDALLMQAAARGDEPSFAALIRRNQRKLLAFFVRLGADIHEAEDAAQETFLRLFRYRARYKSSAPFSVFLFTVARHAWVDVCRRTWRWRRVELLAEMDARPVAAAASLEDRLDMQMVLEELPPAQRMVLVLSLYHGLRYREIASVMEIPEGTVKSRVFHALKKLRQRMSRDATV